MRCPRCGTLDDRVVDSRSAKDGMLIRRRRECLGCGARFTTYERLEVTLPQIIKRDGRRESFRREKLLGGLERACQKRPVSAETLDQIVDQVEHELIALGHREVRADRVGDWVMQALREVDEVAYLRFASVYKSFSDISQFLNEAARVRDDKR